MSGAAAEAAAASLARAKARLDATTAYPTPVRIDRVRVLTMPWFFCLPRLRRFDGFATWRAILLRRAPGAGASDDLICHELCHVWQMQHRPLRMPLSYLRTGYARNPYEAEARELVARTRAAAAARD